MTHLSTEFFKSNTALVKGGLEVIELICAIRAVDGEALRAKI
jgi:hypothetical protein